MLLLACIVTCIVINDFIGLNCIICQIIGFSIRFSIICDIICGICRNICRNICRGISCCGVGVGIVCCGS